MSAEDVKERRIAWAMLIICPLSMMLMFALVTMEMVRGLNWHPVEYLQATCVLWAIVMTVLPALRLANLISLPLWFVALLYANMYMYVLSLCYGMYLDPSISWWGDVTHVISSMVVSSIAFMALCLMESHSPSHVTLGRRGGITVMVFIIGCAFGAIWEIMEGFTDIIASFDYMSYGGAFTLYDMWADMIGSFLTAAIAWMILGRRS
ncbi:MAG: hypothetical protein FWH44_02375, partial [Methanomassiliicoccaceae archaeon]|nr:hypothetical protein [Methanomassiliicoccaceae archaeon]